MPFDWLDFFTLAQQLAASADAASKRTAISRAYYFLFHLSNARAVSNCGPKPPGVTTHAWCWEKFSNTPNAPCSALGTEGDRLKRLRHKADYDSRDIPRLADVCQRMLADVQQFRANFAALGAQFPSP